MSFEASEPERIESEYATQLFEFTPESFVDTITFSTTDIIEEELTKLQSRVKEKFSGKISESELENCFQVIKDQYMESTDKVLTNLGRYVKSNILCIPSHVVLPEDRVHIGRRQFTGEDMENSLKTIDNLCEKIHNAKYKSAVLKAKLANLQKVSQRQEQLVQEFNNLAEIKQQIETLYDSQAALLNEKLVNVRTLTQQLENNQDPTDADEERTARRKELDQEEFILKKKFKNFSDDD